MIIVECHKDKALVHRMGFRGDQVVHEFGRSRVLGRVEQEQRAVGIIDKDPQAGDPGYLEEYTEKDIVGKIRLLIRKDDDGKRVIRRAIQISSRLEDWLCEVGKRNRIPPEKFGLPNNPGELHSMSLKDRENSGKFRRFLIAFNRAKDDEINTLKRWIREAIE
jgi:hypothetical protein